MADHLVSAADRILDLTTSNGDRVWLEPMPGAVRDFEHLRGLKPLARLRATGRLSERGKPRAAVIDATNAREIAAQLVAFADRADAVAAGLTGLGREVVVVTENVL